MLAMEHGKTNDTSVRPRETRVLMADPAHFDVAYAINPFMQANIGKIDRVIARKQWEALRETYRSLGFSVHTLSAVPGLPDLVFMANQSFPVLLPDGQVTAVLSQMHAQQRREEVSCVAEWYASQSIQTQALDVKAVFEGMGDCLWVPSERVIMAGYGFRTEIAGVQALSRCVDATVIPLRLVDPNFYHLDTCLSLIDAERAFFVPEAFDTESIQRLRVQFSELIPIPLDEAIRFLACNGHCPDGKHFIVQEGARETYKRAREQGLNVLPVNTSEFLKSGGSVYCMKLMLP